MPFHWTLALHVATCFKRLLSAVQRGAAASATLVAGEGKDAAAGRLKALMSCELAVSFAVLYEGAAVLSEP